MKIWKTQLSIHAAERLKERTKVDEKTLCRILDDEETIPLGFEIKETNRQSLLIFSPKDEKFFVVVQDQSDGIAKKKPRRIAVQHLEEGRILVHKQTSRCPETQPRRQTSSVCA